ncbi:MAG: MarR family winged helix-turn-helix transcriptional regulator [Microthrixaceae bacterium]
MSSAATTRALDATDGVDGERQGEGPVEWTDDAYRLQVAVTRLARLLRQEVPTELTPSQLSVLSSIRRHGPVTLGELAELERVAPPSITRMVSRLEDDGYVERIRCEDDARVCRVVVTDQAEEMVAGARQAKATWLTERMDDLPATQRRRAVAALEAIEALAGLR